MDGIGAGVQRTRKKRGEGASRRGEILGAAKRLFAEEGVQHVTMRRIAAAVGVSATALYVYFPDKEAILQAIASEHFTALLAALEPVIRPGRPALANLRDGMLAYVQFGLTHPDEYRLTFAQHARVMTDPCQDVPEADRSFDMLLQAVQRAIDEGCFPPKPAMLFAETIWCCAHGLVSLLLSIPDEIVSARDELIEQVVRTSIAGCCINNANLPLLTERR